MKQNEAKGITGSITGNPVSRNVIALLNTNDVFSKLDIDYNVVFNTSTHDGFYVAFKI